jgi:hypothetical protein
MNTSIPSARLEAASGIGKVQVDSWRSFYKGLIDNAFLNSLSFEHRA